MDEKDAGWSLNELCESTSATTSHKNPFFNALRNFEEKQPVNSDRTINIPS
jgi:hypothetical protein